MMWFKLELVEATGIAPATRCLQGSVATLEHGPPCRLDRLAGRDGIEPSKHEFWRLAAVPTRRRPIYLKLEIGCEKRRRPGWFTHLSRPRMAAQLQAGRSSATLLGFTDCGLVQLVGGARFIVSEGVIGLPGALRCPGALQQNVCSSLGRAVLLFYVFP